MNRELKYESDGKCQVTANGVVIAKSYLGEDGYEVRILQGMPRMETIAKIIQDCPDFAHNNNVSLNKVPRLFSKS